MYRKGFTLVESLIAILIIASLAVLMFSGYQKVIERSRDTQCLNNMRTVMQRIHSYLADNNGIMPAFKNPAIGDTWWYYLYSPTEFKDFNREMVCPAKDKPNLKYKLAGKIDLEGSYVFNKNIGWVANPAYPDDGSGKPVKNLLAVRNPSTLAVLGEWSQDTEPGTRLTFSSWVDVLGRHNEGRYATIYFLDGHAERLRRDPEINEVPTASDMLPRTLAPEY